MVLSCTFSTLTYAQSITWNPIAVPDAGITSIEHSGAILCVLTGSSLYHTSDDGLNWERSQPTPSGGYEGGYDILCLTPQTLLLTQFARLWRSTDMGTTWEDLLSDPNYAETRFCGPDTSGGFFAYAMVWGGLGNEARSIRHYDSNGIFQELVYQFQSRVHGFSVSPTGDYVIALDVFQTRDYPWLNKPPRVMHRSPSDPTWYEFPLSGTFYGIVGIAKSPSGKGPMLFVGDNGPGVWRSSDNGLHWAQANNGLSNPYIRGLAGGPDGTLFAFSNGGELFYTTNGGDSWINASPGLPVAGTLVDIAFDATGHVYVADGGGIYRSSEVFTGVQPVDAPEVPREYALGQNYPNPFNPTTIIRYDVRAAADVQLEVCDVLGRDIAILVSERKTVGSYEVTFDGADLPSGIYFCRLTAGDFVQTRKMLLLR